MLTNWRPVFTACTFFSKFGVRGFLAGDFGDNLGDGGGRDEWRFVGGGIFGFDGLSGVTTMC